MDPSIMKLLEEDEDESMHSGADVDAFQAALNRDIGGGDGVDLSQLQSSDSGSAVLPQGGCSGSTQSSNHWQTSSQDRKSESQSQGENQSGQQSEQSSSQMQSNQHGSDTTNQQQQPNVGYPLQTNQSQENLQQRQGEQTSTQIAAMQTPQQDPFSIRETERTQNPESESQYIKMQRMSNQQATGTEQVNSALNKNKQVPFALLLPLIMPQLDKDRAMQLQTLYTKLKKNEIPREGFVRHMRTIAGDQMLRLAVMKSQRQRSGSGHSLPLTQQQQHARVPPIRGMEQQSDSRGVPLSQMSSSVSSAVNQEKEQPTVPSPGQNKQQQQYHFPQTSFPMSGGNTSGSHYSYSGPNVNPSSSTIKLQSHDSQMRQTPLHHGMGSPQLEGATHAMNVSRYEKQSSANDPKRIQGGSRAQFSSNSTLQQNPTQHSGHLSSVYSVKQEPVDQSNEKQNKPHLPISQGFPSFTSPQDEKFVRQSSNTGFPANLSIMHCNSASSSMTSQLDPNAQLGSRISTVPAPAGNSARAIPKKPAVGQKKPLDAAGSSPPPSSKKQKVSGNFLDQSIDQLNDVTAVSGVNLREEEEQLFSGNKEDSRASEAIRRAVQEEEGKLILQKIPLQKKLAEIMAKFGLKNVSNDAERCLSLSVEERLRGLICNVIRVSKQRVDVEKPRHRTIITSDVRQHIMSINKIAREEWEKKQTEADKLRRLNDPDGSDGIGGEKEKDEARLKFNKVNKEEDDKLRATAANVAARAAAGGDDMLSKWQLMAEQNRQKRDGGTDAASGSQSRKTSSSKNIRGNQDTEKRGHNPVIASGGIRKLGRNQVTQPRVARTISVKDIITVLQREPQMSKSTLIYRLYERISSDAVAQ